MRSAVSLHVFLVFLLAVLAMSLAPVYAGSQLSVEPLDFDSDGEYQRFRMHLEVQGEDMYWTVVQGAELARIAADEGYQSRLAGTEPLYTGPALGNRAHETVPRFGALAPVISGPPAEPPVEYEDVFDNVQRLDAVRVVVRPTGDQREIADRPANAYAMAVISEKSRHVDDSWRPYIQMNYGTVWVYDEQPFSPAPLQLSRGVFNFVFAPSAAPGTGDYYQQQLIEALEPLGMLAGARMQQFSVSEEMLATLEEQDWQLAEDRNPGQAAGIAFELLVTEITEQAEPLDYAALEDKVRLDAAGLEYLESPLMTMDLLRLCPPLPEDMSRQELQAAAEENATFRGTMSGPIEGTVVGEARFGRQDDAFGQGFVLAVEAFDEELNQAACLALMRVGDGMPQEPVSMPFTADSATGDAEPGTMIGYLVVADLTEDGIVREVAVGGGERGELRLDSLSDDTVSGSLSMRGNVSTLDDLSVSQGFDIRGEFTADMAWERVPTRR